MDANAKRKAAAILTGSAPTCRGARATAAALAALAALASITCAGTAQGRQADQPDHREFNAALDVPYRPSASPPRTITVHLSYPDPARRHRTSYRLPLQRSNGAPHPSPPARPTL